MLRLVPDTPSLTAKLPPASFYSKSVVSDLECIADCVRRDAGYSSNAAVKAGAAKLADAIDTAAQGISGNIRVHPTMRVRGGSLTKEDIIDTAQGVIRVPPSGTSEEEIRRNARGTAVLLSRALWTESPRGARVRDLHEKPRPPSLVAAVLDRVISTLPRLRQNAP